MTKNHPNETIITLSLIACISQAAVRNFGIISSNILDPTNILECTFFIIAVLNIQLSNLRQTIISVLLAVSVTSLILVSGINNTPYYESLRAYKWLFFLIALLVIGKQSNIRVHIIRTYYLLLLSAVSLSYLIEISIHGLDSRPYLLIENNYECALLIGLFAINLSISNLRLTRKYLGWNSLLVGSVLMSQSRSALVSLLLVISITYLKSVPAKNRIMSAILLTLIGTSLLVLTFNNRDTHLGNLDRLRFLTLFWHEFSSKALLNKVFGDWSIEPLSSATCIQLRFYSSLQHDESVGSCYSVVLHSFILRALNDFGIVGALIIIIVLSKILYSRLESTVAINLLAIALSNSASVSGINNVYVVMPMLFALLTFQIESRPRKSDIVSSNRNYP